MERVVAKMQARVHHLMEQDLLDNRGRIKRALGECQRVAAVTMPSRPAVDVLIALVERDCANRAAVAAALEWAIKMVHARAEEDPDIMQVGRQEVLYRAED